MKDKLYDWVKHHDSYEGGNPINWVQILSQKFGKQTRLVEIRERLASTYRQLLKEDRRKKAAHKREEKRVRLHEEAEQTRRRGDGHKWKHWRFPERSVIPAFMTGDAVPPAEGCEVCGLLFAKHEFKRDTAVQSIADKLASL